MKNLARDWKELISGKENFQEIVRLLVEFDEKSGRYRKYGEPQTHYLRRAVSVAEADALRVFLLHLGGFIYYLVVELRFESGMVATGWIHEDGIRVERDEFAAQPTHPVHNLLCLSDLYEKESRSLSERMEPLLLNSATLNLLAADGMDEMVHSR